MCAITTKTSVGILLQVNGVRPHKGLIAQSIQQTLFCSLNTNSLVRISCPSCHGQDKQPASYSITLLLWVIFARNILPAASTFICHLMQYPKSRRTLSLQCSIRLRRCDAGVACRGKIVICGGNHMFGGWCTPNRYQVTESAKCECVLSSSYSVLVHPAKGSFLQ